MLAKGISLESLEQLSKLYEASKEATAIRMVATNRCACAMMMLDYSYKPTELPHIEQAKHQPNLFDDCFLDMPSMKLRVQSSSAKQFSDFVPKHKSFDESSPLYEVSATKDHFREILFSI